MADGEMREIEMNENKLVIAASIIPCSIAGALIRIALLRLEDYPGAPVSALVYAQWVGCFIMGIVTKNKSRLILWYLPSHPAISSGLCGSITSFSSWQLDIFEEIANYHAYPHTRGKNILSAISEFIVTIAMAINGFIFGHHIGDILHSKNIKTEAKVIPRGFSIRYLTKKDYFVIAFGILSWLGVILASIFTENQKELALACVFAPIGALTRWYLSFYNGKIPHFPIGTFIANIFGTAVLAAISLSQSGPSMLPIACTAVQALADGYCGCLTTVSTFVVELSTLPRKHGYFYSTLSVVVAQIFMFLILGTYIWSEGVNLSCT